MFAYHLSVSDTHFDFEIGFPVNQPVDASGRVRLIELPAVTAVQTTYHGRYEGLYGAWSEFGRQLRQDGAWNAGAGAGQALFREIYRVGPESGLESSDWETDLLIPLPGDGEGET